MKGTPQPIISAQSLTRVFGSGEGVVTAVNGVSLDIFSGEFLAVVGRSGSGKTTLLNLLAGLDRPTGGQVLFQGRDLAEFSEAELLELRRRKIGFVFQSFGLIPLLSAWENVELPLHISGVPWRERRQRALQTLETVGLGPRARHRPYELSGGEQQRVSIARALVTGPEVVFADEPTGELDTTTAMSIATILRDIALERGVTVIAATHDPILAGISRRTVELLDGALKN
jgi:putative ABC transport system ATP-binding protein